MGGACCKNHAYSPVQTHEASSAPTQTTFQNTSKAEHDTLELQQELVPEADLSMQSTDDWKEYKALMNKVFCTFVGCQPSAKFSIISLNSHIILVMRDRVSGFIYQKDLQRFLMIVNLDTPVEDVFRLIDSTAWMNYFTNPSVNPRAADIKQHIEEQYTWKLLLEVIVIQRRWTPPTPGSWSTMHSAASES